MQAINGERITKEEQEQLERGEEITTKDGEKVKYSPKEQTFVQRNNNRLLIASLLIDGGISYLIIKAAERLANKENITESQENKQEDKQGVDKEYVKELEKLKNEIDEKIRRTEDKKELTDIKEYINKEIDRVENVPYQESDLEERPDREDKLEQAEDLEEKQQEEQNVDVPFDEDMEIDDNEEIKHNDSLDDWEREEIEHQEAEFNEQEDGDEEDEDEEQERSRGRSR